MSNNIAVNNNTFELSVTPLAVPSSAIASPNNGVATPASPAIFGINDCKYIEDIKCKIQGDNILVDKITQKNVAPLGTKDDFGCAPLSTAPFTFSNPGAYTITAGSFKSKCSSIRIMVKDNSSFVLCSCAGNDSTSPTPIPFSGSCVIQVNNSGQSINVRTK